MANKAENSVLSVTAPQLWWSETINPINASSNNSKNESGFMDCAYFGLDEDGFVIKSASYTSSTCVNVDESEVETEGNGQFLVPASKLLGSINLFDAEDAITISLAESEEFITLDNGSSVIINIPTVHIADDSMIPLAFDDFPEGIETVEINRDDFIKRYTAGSSMSSSKTDSEGQTVMAGTTVTYADGGLQIFSIDISGVEQWVPFTEGNPQEKASCLTDSSLMVSKINSLPDSDTITFSIDEDSDCIHIHCYDTHMIVNGLNTGNRSSSITFDDILDVLNPVWKERSVVSTMNVGEFTKAIKIASSNKEEYMTLEIGSSNVNILSGKGSNSVQKKVSSDNEWLVDGEEYSVARIEMKTMQKVLSFVPKNDQITVSVSEDEDGEPNALIAYDKESYDADNPHNIFLINARYEE